MYAKKRKRGGEYNMWQLHLNNVLQNTQYILKTKTTHNPGHTYKEKQMDARRRKEEMSGEEK